MARGRTRRTRRKGGAWPFSKTDLTRMDNQSTGADKRLESSLNSANTNPIFAKAPKPPTRLEREKEIIDRVNTLFPKGYEQTRVFPSNVNKLSDDQLKKLKDETDETFMASINAFTKPLMIKPSMPKPSMPPKPTGGRKTRKTKKVMRKRK